MKRLSHSYRNLALVTAISIIYLIIFYLQFTQHFKLDFSSFYSTASALDQGQDPYQNLLPTYLHLPKKLPANLNPPIFLLLLKSLSHFSYRYAVPIWTICSFILGLSGAAIIAKLSFKPAFFQKNAVVLFIIYLALFPTIMNTVIAQMGAILLFFVMAGYQCFLQRRDTLAGCLWGFIASIKLFPALLLLFAFRQQRYRICLIMIATVLILWLIPFYHHGFTLYSQYFQMLIRVLWYGDNWNASFYGFLFRLFVDPNERYQSLVLIKLVYFILFCGILTWYLKKIGPSLDEQTTHYSFCLTLIMMLLLSPFGWLYYFSLLLFPLALTWQRISSEPLMRPQLILLWFLSFFIINLPVDYVVATKMISFISKIGLYSVSFYGVLLLTYLVLQLQNLAVLPAQNANPQTRTLVLPLIIMIVFSLLIPLTYFILLLHQILAI